jgi:hypothetical protein
MPPKPADAKDTGQFLVRKSIFLLSPSLGPAVAEKLVMRGLEFLRVAPDSLVSADIPRLATVLEPSLRDFLGNEKAKRLASALRVLVGGAFGDGAEQK